LTTTSAILLARSFREPRWALPLASSPRFLLGWNRDPPDVDGGVPDAIATVLAPALLAAGAMTVPATRRARRLPANTIATPLALKSGWRAWLPGRRLPAADWLTTSDPAIAQALFDDETFHWEQQATAALIGFPPAGIDAALLDRLTTPDAAGIAALLGADGTRAIVRPGVDGACLGYYAQDDVTLDLAIAQLSQDSAASGIAFTVLSEADFIERHLT
jgi:hypothetical protein